LGRLIGDASVVALSEAVHLAAEPLEFRNRLFRYLVEEKGFTAIAVESGVVEGRRAYDYVRGKDIPLSRALHEGLSWTFDKLPQNEALLRWLERHNADHSVLRKVNFYGFDVPGSPGNPHATRGLDTALSEALEYLRSVDSAAAELFRTRFHPYLTYLRFEFTRDAEGPGYDQLSASERDALTSAIVDLVGLFERRQARYTDASSHTDYEWAYRAAIGARQADAWLRQIPLDWHPSREPVDLAHVEFPPFFSIATDIRDRAQADNLDWIIRREGALGKVLVYGHSYHLSNTPLKPHWARQDAREVMGTYLRRHLGKRLVTIGNLIGGGALGCGEDLQTLRDSDVGAVEALCREVGESSFLLDLRRAPASLEGWLHEEREVGQGFDTLRLSLAKAFDLLFYIDTVTPACQARFAGVTG
jgi:erythromycin esterase